MQLVLPAALVFLFLMYNITEAREAFQDESSIKRSIVVDKSGGGGSFQTVQAAVNSVPSNNKEWIMIKINPGVYNEKVIIPANKQFVILAGADRRTTTITFNDHQSIVQSPTFTSFANNFVARGITFENSFNIAKASKFFDSMKGVYISQAVAARIEGDKSAFYDCGFKGFQDTLWDNQGRHLFQNCYIEGAIDFIFGRAQSFYQNCTLKVNFASLSQGGRGFVTANARESAADPSGFVFDGCTITGAGRALLGRAYRAYSRVIFKETTMSSLVAPEGWDAWRYKGKEGNLVFAEVHSKGPGGVISKRVPWVKKLDASQLKSFSMTSFINKDGWISTIPYNDFIKKICNSTTML